MKNITLIFILLIGAGCSNLSDNNSSQAIEEKSDTYSVETPSEYDTIRINKLPEIGEYISDSIRQTSNNRMRLINSSQFSPATTVFYQELIFNIAWNQEGKVIYISTLDTNFITKDNIKVNMTLKELKTIINSEIHEMPGWGYYLNLESGWNVAFSVDSENGSTGRDLVDTDSVKWIYKN